MENSLVKDAKAKVSRPHTICGEEVQE